MSMNAKPNLTVVGVIARTRSAASIAIARLDLI